MADYVEIELDGGGVMLVETTAFDEYLPAGAGPDTLRRLPETFVAGLARARSVARTALRELRSGVEPPDRVAVEFGLKAVVKTGFVLAESGGEAHLKVTVEWQRGAGPDPGPEPEDVETTGTDQAC